MRTIANYIGGYQTDGNSCLHIRVGIDLAISKTHATQFKE
jgi:hypothetical protein